MIDFNHILLFIASVSAFVMLAQTWRRDGLFRAWRIAAVAVLLVTGAAWLIDREAAGFVGAGAWLGLLLIPAIGLKRVAELASSQRYASARRWAAALRLFHPSRAVRAQVELFRGLALAQDGKFSEAISLLEPLRDKETNAGRQATVQVFRLRGEWAGLASWVRNEVPSPIRRADFALMQLYLRALVEIGARDEMVLEFANLLTASSSI
ncbi:MAG TPA: hypothetical protein VF511_02995, partial [Chthoniobacterales bacterium]